MNLINRKTSKITNRFHYQDPSFENELASTIIPWLPETEQPIVVLCIGTDRSTGDSLGPLTGSLISQQRLQHLILYGTLEQPVHAINLQDKLTEISILYTNPFIIAVDASLGNNDTIGTVVTEKRALQPGAALKKKLPAIGNIHLSGVVNGGGHMPFAILQNTRLHIVMEMAKKIAIVFQLLDNTLKQKSI